MAAPRKYSEERKERATRLALDARGDPASKVGAIKRIADQLGIHPEALRTWVRQAEVDGGIAPGVTTADAQRIVDLERENREWRGANEILKTASAFFAAVELDRKLKWRCPQRCSSSTSTGTAAGSGSSRSARCCAKQGCRSPRAPTTPPRRVRRRSGRSGTPH